MEFDPFCKYFFAATHVPITCVNNGEIVSIYGLREEISPYRRLSKKLEMIRESWYVEADEYAYYGIVRQPEGQNAFLILGPTFTIDIDVSILEAYMLENDIDFSLREEVYYTLSKLPQLTHYSFLSMVCLFDYLYNGNELIIRSDFKMAEDIYGGTIASSQLNSSYLHREYNYTHGTHDLERRIRFLVESGKPEKLEELMQWVSDHNVLNEGKHGPTPLRHAKNIFIALVSDIGKHAAIAGGMDIEQVYQLIDEYTLKCEQLRSMDAVATLQYNMLVDFARRVSRTRLPPNLSAEMIRCLQFIHGHLNEKLTVQDVANHVYLSKSCVNKLFRKELGASIAEYIASSRIEEAKELLVHTDKNISEISSYLTFSTQSYFQNKFKKVTGMTPLAFRRANSGTQAPTAYRQKD